MNIVAALKTDPGNSPLPIQDRASYQFFSEKDKSMGLFIIADGMGGQSDGDRASQMTNEIVSEDIQNHFANQLSTKSEALKAALRRAIKRANQAIYETAQAEGKIMGSTITCALIAEDWAIVANVGDSRTYLYRQGQLRQITRDHSMVEELIQKGIMPAEERLDNRYVNVLTRGVGAAETIDIDFFELDLFPRDRMMLCSDGLWGMVQDVEIVTHLQKREDLIDICLDLVAAANEAGGKDHISVVLVELEPLTE